MPKIGSQVQYHRDNAYSFMGEVLTVNEGTNRALVQWTDCFGQSRQSLVGVEFLRVIEPKDITATASELESPEAA